MQLNTEQRQKIQHRLESLNVVFIEGDVRYVGGPLDDVVKAVAAVLLADLDA